jgi:Family of unknown function (DUF6545)
VTTLQAFQGALSYGVLALMVYLLMRSPRNVQLRAITIMIASVGLSYTVGLAAGSGHPVLGVEPIVLRLIQHFLQLATGYSLILFYLFSALERQEARRRALWHLVPLVLAAVIMTVSVAVMPVQVRDAAALLPAGRPGGPVSVTSVALLYLSVNIYRTYAFSSAFLWTRRYARGAEPRLRHGLAIASFGLASVALALALLATANVVRWNGGVMPHDLLIAGMVAVVLGYVIFLIGIAYPAAVMRLAALRVWSQHRRVYRQLAPLWTVLHREFPEDALSRVPARVWQDTLSLRGVHRRYYRRVIECRDGLVRISPYLGQLNGSATLAERLREGLRAHASGTPVPPRATPVAIPSDDGLDADVHELLALSSALRTSD